MIAIFSKHKAQIRKGRGNISKSVRVESMMSIEFHWVFNEFQDIYDKLHQIS